MPTLSQHATLEKRMAKPTDAPNALPVIIFTDGACSGNPGPGGWAAILISPLGKVKELGGGEENTTNNRMELGAALEALRSLARVKTLSTRKIRIYTDSKYVIQGITEWMRGWRRNGWKTAAGKDVANREYWEALDAEILKNQFQVEWLYVPGHSGFPGNERCDEIAVAYSKGMPASLFNGELKDYFVDVSHLPEAAPITRPAAAKKKGPPVYLSWVNGSLHRDKDWKSCEARVKGRAGAKFRKVESPQEEAAVLETWGLKNST